ncbi:hypothetical protein [Crocosphaera chwakensis]|uniref:Uncharacterized protein n=1 Tax=Crocosphaera chwakensis CCY0110 TaxID=391612 RepID=A3IU26_9CHRO|nr:hypothetical protein [Crocosphaera chwakensis]EAZ90000.1 hypothetical protein CY0110_20695 [Crocosphaera chwakensis CCY0110]
MADITREEMRDRLGNIEQIRDLLFGNTIREYEKRFQQCEQNIGKLTRDFSLFETETRDRLDQIQDSLTTEIRSVASSLDKKLKYLSMTTHEQINQLEKELDSTAKNNSRSIESLNQNITGQTDLLRNDLVQTKDKLQKSMQSLREELFEIIQNELVNLKDNKVSRTDLADILFELCVKIKGDEFVTEFPENTEQNSHTELFLLEQKASLESESNEE